MKTYGSEPGEPQTDPLRVGISEFAVSDGDETMKSYGLGSCLAVGLWDPTNEIGGLAHVMLPNGDNRDDGDRKPGKFADTAIRTMLRRIVEMGGDYTSVEAKITGGSEMFEFDSFEDGVGERNVLAARKELEKLGVPVTAEDVGGERGRTVEFDAETGTLSIRTPNGDDPVKEL